MQRTYKIVEKNRAGEDTGIYVDAIKYRDPDTHSPRVFLETGTTFTVQLDTEKVLDRRFREPKEVDTGREYVVSSDLDVLPGDLTSCIRTGRAADVEKLEAPAPAPKKKAPARRLAKKTK